jgi:anhydro-N-acetylmuramic acid kinase
MTPTPTQTMIVAGVMSGTSADGINVAFVRIGNTPSRDKDPSRSGKSSNSQPLKIELLAHAEYSYPLQVRRAILNAMNAEQASVADLARLNVLLGELYADAVLKAQRGFRIAPDLIGCHGQTLYHQGEAQLFLGKKISTTWQTGEGAIIAARTGVPVVSDFRLADMANGGKGAPLVPYLDYRLFRHAKIGRIVQNIGGIANLTAIAAGADASDVFAFDTGPGNMVIDQVVETLTGKRFDHGGKISASGHVIEHVVDSILKHAFFRQRPPKTAGREEFGREFVGEFLRHCKGAPRADIVATATALTARSIADAVRRFVIKPAHHSSRNSFQGDFQEILVSGGGVKNVTLISMLTEAFAPLGIRLRRTDEFGLPSQAKEATAFALLAYETWHRRPSNVPSATGAKHPAVLGKTSYA